MTGRLIRKAVYTALGVFLLAGSLVASPSQNPPDSAAVSATVWDFQREASDLLREIRDVSGRLRMAADRLESFTRSKPSWQSHGDQLALVKDHINQMGGRLERLQQIRHVIVPWQEQAIDRMVPIAVELASRTQAAIEHLNENRSHLSAPIYTDHLGTIAEQTSTLNDSANDFLEYGRAQDKLEQLRQKLEIGAS